MLLVEKRKIKEMFCSALSMLYTAILNSVKRFGYK